MGFRLGKKVRVKTSGMTGVVKAVYEFGYWNMAENEYGIEMDDGSGLITLIERVLESIEPEPVCECGQKGISYAKHSDWCPLYEFDK